MKDRISIRPHIKSFFHAGSGAVSPFFSGVFLNTETCRHYPFNTAEAIASSNWGKLGELLNWKNKKTNIQDRK